MNTEGYREATRASVERDNTVMIPEPPKRLRKRKGGSYVGGKAKEVGLAVFEMSIQNLGHTYQALEPAVSGSLECLIAAGPRGSTRLELVHPEPPENARLGLQRAKPQPA